VRADPDHLGAIEWCRRLDPDAVDEDLGSPAGGVTAQVPSSSTSIRRWSRETRGSAMVRVASGSRPTWLSSRPDLHPPTGAAPADDGDLETVRG